MTLSEKILALGTEQGRIHVLDYSGNQVRQLNVHKTRVNDISFDKDGEHVASASSDCSVVVTNLYTEQVTRHEFRTPVKAVALDPRPPASASSARSSWRDLVTGSVGGEVTLHTKGWLGRVDTPLAAAASRDAAAGGVLALRWSGALVAWAFDSAVSIYDTQSSQLVRTLRRHETRPPGAAAPPPPPSPPGAAVRPAPAGTAAAAAAGAAAAGAASSLNDLRRCSLLFAPDSHLYVSWSDVILVARISTYQNNVGAAAPQVEVVARMSMTEAVLGVSPYGDNDLAVLVYPNGLAAPAAAAAPTAPATPAAAPATTPAAAQPQSPAQAAAGGGGGGGGAAAPAAAAVQGTAAAGGGDLATQAEGAGQGEAPDPLAPGRTPQLVILARADHREWARDAVHLPGADRLAPRQYLGLLPSLPQHLQQQQQPAVAGPAVAGSAVAGAGAPGPAVAAAAAAGGTPFGGRSGAAAAGTAAAGGATTPRRASGTGGGGGSGAGSGAATPRASVASSVGSVSPAPGGGLGQPAAPRRLVPIWIDGQELMLFVAAPTAVATARSRDAADRVSWLLERRRWEEALGVVEQAAPGALPPGTYDKVIDGYIEELMTGQAYDTAVQLAGRLLGGQAQRWERFVYLFAQVRQLPKLVPYIPTDHPRLRTAVYDMALQSLLPSPADHPTLLAVAKSWPPGAFSMAALADAVAARLRRLQQQQQAAATAATAATAARGGGGGGTGGAAGGAGASGAAPLPAVDVGGGEGGAADPLWQLLAWLYEQQGRPDLALSIYLRLRSPGVFAFVTSHGLQANLLGRAADLFEVDERAALGLLTAHADALPPGNVVPSLQDAMRSAASAAACEVWRRRLHAYLAALFAVDSSTAADWHDLQVSLTADYQPSKLMDLLVTSQYYSLEAALSICEARGLVSEQVFVLGRMGNADQALRLIIDRLGDIPRAIDFVVGQRDEELWGRLIDWALGSPDTTGQLLDCIGGYVDPLLLVRRIPRGMEVARLRDRLRAIIADYRTQTSLREGCNAILRSDCRHLLARLLDGSRRALPSVLLQLPRPGGGEAGAEGAEWFRCDVVHGGRLQPVPASEVPWEAGVGAGGGPGGDTAAAAAAHLPGGTAGGRGSSSHLTHGGAGAAAAGMSRAHGASAPALEAAGAGGGAGARRRAAALGSGGAGGAGAGNGSDLVPGGLPAWALEDAAAAAGAVGAAGGGVMWATQPAGTVSESGSGSRGFSAGSGAGAGAGSGSGLWVGFNLAAGRARLGGEDGMGGHHGGPGGGNSRRGLGGLGQGPGGIPRGPASAAGAAAGAGGGGGRVGGGMGWSSSSRAGAGGGPGGGGGTGGIVLGSLWRHMTGTSTAA
ncbi:hypothetical protein CHLRE_03g209281v5 [Chlamydomonas reinhardtii]|uniref:Vps41 beta-propeller domain-containing protein n=1 Tax=Chlamydomonas reinhardtii TaxID=3055 RepID=A0A2K3DZT8_CHLRE|nr:uncharacterized protein CHLRE_03g209281v5 [Chlamydomonas reinhardtii]PNW86054.1 hypothetical protein CHLRE_03g209281v5 [Chlamydomonas reinhardtii]